jgi:hypothetical protein
MGLHGILIYAANCAVMESIMANTNAMMGTILMEMVDRPYELLK